MVGVAELAIEARSQQPAVDVTIQIVSLVVNLATLGAAIYALVIGRRNYLQQDQIYREQTRASLHVSGNGDLYPGDLSRKEIELFVLNDGAVPITPRTYRMTYATPSHGDEKEIYFNSFNQTLRPGDPALRSVLRARGSGLPILDLWITDQLGRRWKMNPASIEGINKSFGA